MVSGAETCLLGPRCSSQRHGDRPGTPSPRSQGLTTPAIPGSELPRETAGLAGDVRDAPGAPVGAGQWERAKNTIPTSMGLKGAGGNCKNSQRPTLEQFQHQNQVVLDDNPECKLNIHLSRPTPRHDRYIFGEDRQSSFPSRIPNNLCHCSVFQEVEHNPHSKPGLQSDFLPERTAWRGGLNPAGVSSASQWSVTVTGCARYSGVTVGLHLWRLHPHT